MKRVVFEGDALEVLRKLPVEAKRRCGYEIDRVQRNLEPTDWKPFASIGQGVREIRIKSADQYRAIYIAKFGNSVHILHIFSKKTQKTRASDIAQAKSRLKRVIKRYQHHAERI